MSSKSILPIITLLVGLGAGFAGHAFIPSNETPQKADCQAEIAQSDATSPQNVESHDLTDEAQVEDVDMKTPEINMPSSLAETVPASGTDNFNLSSALKPRAMGADDAPIVIEEFASLSCGHCAHFHNDTLPSLIENYVDTGKVKFVFNDYPLNSPAMDATMVARCMPEGQYFKFLKFLFETQEKWAFTADYQQNIKQNAKLLGASEEMLESCLSNNDLKEGLVENMKKASDTHEIKSTPSFVINGEVVRGNHSFEALSQIIDSKLKESTTEN